MLARLAAVFTRQFRSKAFRGILRQKIAYFDGEKRSTSTLYIHLAIATEASGV